MKLLREKSEEVGSLPDCSASSSEAYLDYSEKKCCVSARGILRTDGTRLAELGLYTKRIASLHKIAKQVSITERSREPRQGRPRGTGITAKPNRDNVVS